MMSDVPSPNASSGLVWVTSVRSAPGLPVCRLQGTSTYLELRERAERTDPVMTLLLEELVAYVSPDIAARLLMRAYRLAGVVPCRTERGQIPELISRALPPVLRTALRPAEVEAVLRNLTETLSLVV